MAQETTVAVKINAQTGGTESVKSLKAQITEATNEATRLAEEFGKFSPQAIEAAKKAADLKQQMGDVQKNIAAIGANKFEKIAAVVGGMASGIQAAQGAMALFGSESENLQKSLLKVQGAMALAQGVQGVIALTNQFKALGQVAVQALNNIAKGLGRTGIGLLVVALGIAITELVANWDKLKAIISGTNKIQESLNKSLSAYNEGAKEASLKTMEVAMAFDNAKKGVISKEEALQIYNEQLGDVLGSQTDLNAAEQVFIQNADVYVEAAAKRKQIDALLTQAAEIESKARMDAQQAEIDFNKDKYATAYDKYLMQREQKYLKAKATEEAAAAKSAAKQVGNELAELTKGTKVKFNVSVSGAKATNAAIESEQQRHLAELKKAEEYANNENQKSLERWLNLRNRQLQLETDDEYEKQIITFDRQQESERTQSDAIYKIRQTAIEQNRKLTENENEIIAQLEREAAFLEKIQSKERANFITDLEKKKNDDLNKIREDAEKQRKEIQDKEISDTFAATEKLYENKKNQLTLQGAAQAEFDNLEIQRLEAQLQNAKDYGELAKDETLRIEAELFAKKKEMRDKDLANQRAAEAASIELTKQGFAALSQLADSFAGQSEAQQKKAFQIKKAASIAQTLIETYQAAQSAYASQMTIPTPEAPIRAAVAAGIAIASGLARVAAIQKTKFEGGGGGNNPATPNAPQTTPLTGGTLPDTEAGQFAGMGKVYVLEGDITKTQTRVRRVRNVSVV